MSVLIAQKKLKNQMKCLLFVTFLQNELIRKDEIIKSLLEAQTSIPEIVSKPSVEEEKK